MSFLDSPISSTKMTDKELNDAAWEYAKENAPLKSESWPQMSGVVFPERDFNKKAFDATDLQYAFLEGAWFARKHLTNTEEDD